MIEAGAVIAGSFLASAHCVGMCGGLAAAIGASRAPLGPMLGRQLIYTSGRIFTYAFLGAVGGLAGSALGNLQTPLIGAQQVFSILAGVVMLLVGLSTLGILPKRAGGAGPLSRLFAPIFNHFLNTPGRWGYFLAGLATGFLPCGLVYAFLALAVATGNAMHGLALMAWFGLGTAPAMILVGCGSGLLTHAARAHVLRLAACFMIIMGAAAIYRAAPTGDKPCCDHTAIATDSPPTEPRP